MGKQPHYRLESVYKDGTKGEPELYDLKEIDGKWSMSRRGFIGAATALMVLCAGCASTKSVSKEETLVMHVDLDGVTYRLACGSPIPPGAVCTCNCIPSSYVTHSSGYSTCTCDKICTCIPVYR